VTTADLITNVLDAIRGQFYADAPRDFLRDLNALKRALATWGHECHQRGWDFDAAFIQKELLTLLNEIKRTGADIDYLPIYLGGAIRKRIGVRAEELSAAWKSLGARTGRVVKKMEAGVVSVVIEPTATEVLSTLYQDMKRARRERKAQPASKARQGELL
jgi:hypothetical protein